MLTNKEYANVFSAAKNWFEDKYGDFQNSKIREASLAEMELVSALGEVMGESKPDVGPEVDEVFKQVTKLRQAGDYEGAQKLFRDYIYQRQFGD